MKISFQIRVKDSRPHGARRSCFFLPCLLFLLLFSNANLSSQMLRELTLLGSPSLVESFSPWTFLWRPLIIPLIPQVSSFMLHMYFMSAESIFYNHIKLQHKYKPECLPAKTYPVQSLVSPVSTYSMHRTVLLPKRKYNKPAKKKRGRQSDWDVHSLLRTNDHTIIRPSSSSLMCRGHPTIYEPSALNRGPT